MKKIDVYFKIRETVRGEVFNLTADIPPAKVDVQVVCPVYNNVANCNRAAYTAIAKLIQDPNEL